MPNELTKADNKRLQELEQIIDKGQRSFIEVGLALAEVRDKKLYKVEYETFEDYICKKWKWTKRHVYRLIECAPIAKSDTRVTSVKQAVALKDVPKSERAKVVVEASSNGKLTAKSITSTARRLLPPKDKKEVLKDSTGLPVPEGIVALWKSGEEVQELLFHIRASRLNIEKRQKENDLLFHEVDFNSVIANLKQAQADIERAKPYAVCPTCQGKLLDKCTTCKASGFVSKFYWETCVDSETREMRGKIVKA